jgi:laminin, gamma 1
MHFHCQFRVHSHPSLQWSPTLRETDYIAVLSNVSAIKIRGTYSKGDVGFLSNFSLGSASLTATNGGNQIELANWVEQCKCGEAFVGQFCESCGQFSHNDSDMICNFQPMATNGLSHSVAL